MHHLVPDVPSYVLSTPSDEEVRYGPPGAVTLGTGAKVTTTSPKFRYEPKPVMPVSKALSG
ncbi:hypothetical protein STANM309S_05170 [Streptomyces tanashiensis]